MKRAGLLLVACAMLAGCAPLIYGPNDTDSGHATGTILPLADALPDGTRTLNLVFIHGVSDIFPGYALGYAQGDAHQEGWLNADVRHATGLVPADPPTALPVPHRVNACVFRQTDRPDCTYGEDPESNVWYYVKHYDVPLRRSCQADTPGCATPGTLHVRAIEITWSTLTQWVKTHRLYFDTPSLATCPAVDADPDHVPTCVRSVQAVPGSPTPPMPAVPGRLLGNRLIKEGVLDRDLADALIYIGPYGALIENATSEALCRALRDDGAAAASPGEPCGWTISVPKDNAFIFVTHSLGSRILIDTIMDSVGAGAPAADKAGVPDLSSDQQVGFAQVLCATPAIYMMANQMALLDLGELEADMRSTDTQCRAPRHNRLHRARKPGDARRSAEAAEVRKGVDGALREQADDDASGDCGGNLRLLGRLHRTLCSTQPATLHIVAFHDTNDLLTWPVPRWYRTDTPNWRDTIDIDFVNVFGQNSLHWWPVWEDPLAAHQNYFKSAYVWELMHCGAKDGKPLPCPQK